MFLPTELYLLAQRTRVSAQELLWQHSVFPYAVAFLSPGHVADLEERTLAVSPESQPGFGALVRSATRNMSALRFCPECAREDVLRYGESYWHREPCLPAVHVCLRHNIDLCVARFTARTLSQLLLLPLPHRQMEAADCTSCPIDLRVPLAEAVHRLCARDWTHRPDWPGVHRAVALERGFTLSGRFLAGARISFELQARFGREYLAELGCSYGNAGSSWPAMLTREGSRCTYSPVKHVLLDTFFRLPAERRGVFVYRTPGKKPTDLVALDPRLALMVNQEAEKLQKFGQTATVERLLRATGHWEVFRHKRDQLPKTNAEVLAFRKTDASERKSGGRAAHAGKLRAIAEGRQKPFRTWRQRPKHETPTSED